MWGRVASLVLVGVAAVALSGCFGLRGSQWNAASVKPGKAVTAKLTVAPQLLPGPTGTNASHKDIPFTMVGFNTDDTFDLLSARFDPKGRFGGPRTMFKDGAFAQDVFDDGRCDPTDFDVSIPLEVLAAEWTAVRTQARVNDRGRPARATTELIKLRPHANLAAGIPSVVFVTGAWNDDGDGVLDSEDGLACTGTASTSIPVLP